MINELTIGILALQGAFEAHQKKLDALKIRSQLVRKAQDLKHIHALILPGGESSSMIKLLKQEQCWEPLSAFAAKHPLLGTCAGLILLARAVKPEQSSLGLLDIVVQRNAYGRQAHSQLIYTQSKLGNVPLPMLFIRAPLIVALSDEVEVLAMRDKNPVLIRQKRWIGCSFHPELTDDFRVHELFIEQCTS